MTTCIHCNKNFVNKYNLLRHQKSSLKCINKNNDENIEVVKFDCKYCNKTLTSSSNLDRHMKICKKKDRVEIESLKRQLENINNDSLSDTDSDSDDTTNNINNIDSHNTRNNTYNNTYNININVQDFKDIRILDLSVVKENSLQQESELNNTDNNIDPQAMTSEIVKLTFVIIDKDRKTNKKDFLLLVANILKDCSDGLYKAYSEAVE